MTKEERERKEFKIFCSYGYTREELQQMNYDDKLRFLLCDLDMVSGTEDERRVSSKLRQLKALYQDVSTSTNKGYIFGIKQENVIRQLQVGNAVYLIDKYQDIYSIKKAIDNQVDYDFDFDFRDKQLALMALNCIKVNQAKIKAFARMDYQLDIDIVTDYQMRD